MPASPLAYPIINGVRYDHSSLSIKVAGVSVFGVKSLDYSDGLEPGKGYGTGAQKVIRTRGIYDADGSIEVFKAEYDQIIVPAVLALSPSVGLYEIAFGIDVNYVSEGGLPPVTDKIVGCRIKKPSNSSASGGSDALSVKVELDIMYILRNGVAPITGLKK